MKTLTIEELFTSTAAGFGVPASSVQRAILRVLEGRPLEDLVDQAHVLEAFGVSSAGELPTTAPLEFDLLSGIRTGKSQLAACRALHASQTVDVGNLSPGEVPRVSVISLDVDKARVVLDLLVGTMTARPPLRRLLVDDPKGDTVLVRHPSGRPIEIACVAGSRAGGSVVARWSAGAIFDEFPRMFGSADGAVVNYDDARRAVLGRLLPGAQVLSIGSPWAPMGPAYERHLSRFGKPTAEHVVVRARADWMNPVWWTEERCERLRASDDLAYATDVEAQFADPSETFIAASEIRHATRVGGPSVLAPVSGSGVHYLACMDPGTRGNAWTLVVLGRHQDAEGAMRFEVALAREWRGTAIKPLSPWRVLKEIQALIAPYWNMRRIYTDQHAGDAIRDLGARMQLEVVVKTVVAGNARDDGPANPSTVHRNDMFEALKAAFSTHSITIPDDKVLASDLRSVRRRLTQVGIGYDLPRTSDGRHADYAPALAMALQLTPKAADLVAAGRRVEHSRRLAVVGAMMAGAVPPEALDRAIAITRGADPSAWEESIFTRIARARHAAESAGAPTGTDNEGK